MVCAHIFSLWFVTAGGSEWVRKIERGRGK